MFKKSPKFKNIQTGKKRQHTKQTLRNSSNNNANYFEDES